MVRHIKHQKGQLIVEVLVAFGLSMILVPAILTGFVNSENGKVQETARTQALALLKEEEDALRSIREKDWNSFSVNGTFHPIVSGTSWVLTAGTQTINEFTRSIILNDAYRDGAGKIVDTPGTIDPSVKKVTLNVNWGTLPADSITTIYYLTRFVNNQAWLQTTQADFNTGVLGNVQVTNTLGGEIKLANNNKAKWCSPALSTATIDLPDGPPVAVSAYANLQDISIPNNVFVATAPDDSTSVKMSYVTVTANTDPPVPTQKGIFTMNQSEYSSINYYPTGVGLDNNFKTNDIKYYTSASGKIYALLATDLPTKEVVVVQINDGARDSFQDPTNKIYKYWTFFNTKQYPASPGNDQAPFNYGAAYITVLGTTGYLDSGGYLYAFDLSNIDTKTTSVGLDQKGCRILLDGYDCSPGSGTDKKYNAGETGTSWSDTTSPAHNNCSDGGNIEINADHQLSGVTVNGKSYIYVAVGAGTNPELNIVDVSTPPTASNTLRGSSCGRGSNTGWKVTGTLDFDPAGGTEEAANSVYARNDGNRAYMSSNGGILHGGIPDSDQFYIIDTTNKASPKFLSTWSSNGNSPAPGHYANTAQTGFYNGDSTNIQLYPRRALTVLNGQRAIIVGQDGVADSIEPKEYQVLNIDPSDPGGNREVTPLYCGGINFLPGFNDLTSVSEADGDNFVYMVANTLEKQLKIIQGGPDSGIYVDTGTFESGIFSVTNPAAFNSFLANVTLPANTNIKMQIAVAAPVNGTCTTASFNYLGPDGTNATFFTPAGTTISGPIPYGTFSNFTNPERCVRFKSFLSSSDYNQTPVLNDVSINYSP